VSANRLREGVYSGAGQVLGKSHGGRLVNGPDIGYAKSCRGQCSRSRSGIAMPKSYGQNETERHRNRAINKGVEKAQRRQSKIPYQLNIAALDRHGQTACSRSRFAYPRSSL
jgi:hypothetical protein